jgi:NitT/TauT family transport system permease protein
MRTLGASKFQISASWWFPASLTDILPDETHGRICLIGAIAGEFMSSSEGLRHAIFKAGSLYVIPPAALVATIALALVLTFVVGKSNGC